MPKHQSKKPSRSAKNKTAPKAKRASKRTKSTSNADKASSDGDARNSGNDEDHSTEAVAVRPFPTDVNKTVGAITDPLHPNKLVKTWKASLRPCLQILAQGSLPDGVSLQAFEDLDSLSDVRTVVLTLVTKIPFFLPDGILPKDFRAHSAKQAAVVLTALALRHRFNCVAAADPTNRSMLYPTLNRVLYAANAKDVYLGTLAPAVKKWCFPLGGDDLAQVSFRLDYHLAAVTSDPSILATISNAFSQSHHKASIASVTLAHTRWFEEAASATTTTTSHAQPGARVSTGPNGGQLFMVQPPSPAKPVTGPTGPTAAPASQSLSQTHSASHPFTTGSNAVDPAAIFPSAAQAHMPAPGSMPLCQAAAAQAAPPQGFPSVLRTPEPDSAGKIFSSLLGVIGQPAPASSSAPAHTGSFVPSEAGASEFALRQEQDRVNKSLVGIQGLAATEAEVDANPDLSLRWAGAKASCFDDVGVLKHGAILDNSFDDGNGLPPSITGVGRRYPLFHFWEINPATAARSGFQKWLRTKDAAAAIIRNMASTGNGALPPVATAAAMFSQTISTDTDKFSNLSPAFELKSHSAATGQVLDIIDKAVSAGTGLIPFGAFHTGELLQEFLSLVAAVSSKNFYLTPALHIPIETLANKIMEEHKRKIPLFQLFQIMYGQFKFLIFDGQFEYLAVCSDNSSLRDSLSKQGKSSFEKCMQQLMTENMQASFSKHVDRQRPHSDKQLIDNFFVIKLIWLLTHGETISLPIFHNTEVVLKQLITLLGKKSDSDKFDVADDALTWIASYMKRALDDFAQEWRRLDATVADPSNPMRLFAAAGTGLHNFKIHGPLWVSMADHWKLQMQAKLALKSGSGSSSRRNDRAGRQDRKPKSSRGSGGGSSGSKGSNSGSSNGQRKREADRTPSSSKRGTKRPSPAANSSAFMGSKKVEKRFATIARLSSPHLDAAAKESDGSPSFGHWATKHDDNTDNHYANRHPRCCFKKLLGTCKNEDSCNRCIGEKDHVASKR